MSLSPLFLSSAVASRASGWPGPGTTPRGDVAALAEQADRLARRAWFDAATGVINRRTFAAEVGGLRGAPGVSVVAVRVFGFGDDPAQGEALVAMLAEVLRAYPRRVPGAFVARLQDHDLALCLPVPGVAAETADALGETLRGWPPCRTGEVAVACAAIDSAPSRNLDLAGDTASALDRAQAAGRFSIECSSGTPDAAASDERSWRRAVEQALADGRCRITRVPVLDHDGHTVLFGAPLLVSTAPGEEFESGRRCLSRATRRRLQPQLDARAIALALVAIQQDGMARSVRVDPVSLSAAPFLAEGLRLMLSHPRAAQRLWVTVAVNGSLASLRPRLLMAIELWRGAGVQLGIELPPLSALEWPWLADLDLTQVTLGGRFVRGLVHDEHLRMAVTGLLRLGHALGWRVFVDDIDDPAEVSMLHALGCDGVSASAA